MEVPVYFIKNRYKVLRLFSIESKRAIGRLFSLLYLKDGEGDKVQFHPEIREVLVAREGGGRLIWYVPVTRKRGMGLKFWGSWMLCRITSCELGEAYGLKTIGWREVT